MRIGIIGAGAIGCLTAAYLKLKGKDVVVAGHGSSVSAIKKNGLCISGVRGDFRVELDVYEKLPYSPDLVILTTKTQDLQYAISDNINYIRGSLALTVQNGVQADQIAAGCLSKENVFSSVVMFGSTYLGEARLVHNFEGPWVLGYSFEEKVPEELSRITEILSGSFPVVVSENIKGMKLLKIFANANNCLPAILGKSMQEVFSDPEISCISVAIWKEGLEVIAKSGLKLVSLPGFPLEKITGLASLPVPQASAILSQTMKNLSSEPLYGSILQSIMRGRKSEIDYINGEFLRIAEKSGVDAPLNRILVGLVHQVEDTKRFFSKEELMGKVERCGEIK
ncbi:MAG: 2-dehydropantoate 2-reductase [Candidatus Omnitrophota bacterium]